MVIVTMSDNHTSNIFFFAFETFNIWDDVVDARHVFFWPLETHIDNDNVIFILKDRHIAADFFITSERYDCQFARFGFYSVDSLIGTWQFTTTVTWTAIITRSASVTRA